MIITWGATGLGSRFGDGYENTFPTLGSAQIPTFEGASTKMPPELSILHFYKIRIIMFYFIYMFSWCVFLEIFVYGYICLFAFYGVTWHYFLLLIECFSMYFMILNLISFRLIFRINFKWESTFQFGTYMCS